MFDGQNRNVLLKTYIKIMLDCLSVKIFFTYFIQLLADPQVSLKTNNNDQNLLSKHESMSKMVQTHVIRKQIPEKDYPKDNSVSEDSSSVSDDRDEQTHIVKRGNKHEYIN